jgi:hypothetical protein
VIAYVDESMRLRDGSLYVLAAVLLDDERCDAIRERMRTLLLPRQQRLHWRDETHSRRRRILETIVELEAFGIVISHRGAHRQDRARALCLRALLWELWAADARALVIESRQARNDQKDRRTIVAAQKVGEASPDLRYSFRGPKDEPLLWLPDAIAGARTSGNDVFLELLDGILVRHREVGT